MAEIRWNFVDYPGEEAKQEYLEFMWRFILGATRPGPGQQRFVGPNITGNDWHLLFLTPAAAGRQVALVVRGRDLYGVGVLRFDLNNDHDSEFFYLDDRDPVTNQIIVPVIPDQAFHGHLPTQRFPLGFEPTYPSDENFERIAFGHGNIAAAIYNLATTPPSGP